MRNRITPNTDTFHIVLAICIETNFEINGKAISSVYKANFVGIFYTATMDLPYKDRTVRIYG